MHPDGTVIVYASPRSGNGDIYRVNIEGTNVVRLTSDENYEGDAKYSPDARRIVFVREEGGVGNIWIMAADGSGQVQITNGPEYDCGPEFSPDGSAVVFTRFVREWRFTVGTAVSAEVFVISEDGSQERRLTDNERADWEPTWLPNGDEIAYSVGSEELWIMRTDGSDNRQIGLGSSPNVSPDGKSLVFLSGEYAREISVMDLTEKSTRRVYRSDSYKSSPTVCLHGSHILFLDEFEGSGVGDITLVSLENGIVKRVTSTK